jgi:hypothetical protein
MEEVPCATHSIGAVVNHGCHELAAGLRVRPSSVGRMPRLPQVRPFSPISLFVVIHALFCRRSVPPHPQILIPRPPPSTSSVAPPKVRPSACALHAVSRARARASDGAQGGAHRGLARGSVPSSGGGVRPRARAAAHRRPRRRGRPRRTRTHVASCAELVDGQAPRLGAGCLGRGWAPPTHAIVACHKTRTLSGGAVCVVPVSAAPSRAPRRQRRCFPRAISGRHPPLLLGAHASSAAQRARFCAPATHRRTLTAQKSGTRYLAPGTSPPRRAHVRAPRRPRAAQRTRTPPSRALQLSAAGRSRAARPRPAAGHPATDEAPRRTTDAPLTVHARATPVCSLPPPPSPVRWRPVSPPSSCSCAPRRRLRR